MPSIYRSSADPGSATYVDIHRKYACSWRRALYHPSLESEIQKYEREVNLPRRHKRTGTCVSMFGYRSPTPRPNEPCCLLEMYLDLDCKRNREKARREAVKALAYLESVGVHARARYSGSKGYGIEIRGEEFQHTIEFHREGHRLARRFAELIMDEAGLDPSVVDMSFYNRRQGGVTILNSIHQKTGRHVIPLTLHELQTLTTRQIRKMAKEPRRISTPEMGWSDELATLFARARATYLDGTGIQRGYRTSVSPDMLPRMGAGRWPSSRVTPCLSSLLLGGRRNLSGRRNDLTVVLPVLLRALGYDRDTAIEVVEWVFGSKMTSGTHTVGRANAGRGAVDWAFNGEQEINPGTCNYLRELGLQCTEDCPYNAEYRQRGHTRRIPTRREDYTPPPRRPGTPRQDGYRQIREGCEQYLALDHPRYRYLRRDPPGAGKSHNTLSCAADYKTTYPNRRMLYIAERHDLGSQSTGKDPNRRVQIYR